MLAQDLVTNEILPIALTDNASQVVERMVEFKVSHLPVVDGGKYFGLISESIIMEQIRPEQTMEVALAKLLPHFISENQHVYEAIDIFSRFELTILPVLSLEKKYLGCITLPDLVFSFNRLTSASQPGAILILAIALQDYSSTMLSKIIEENNAKIVSLYVVTDSNGRDLSVTIKVNTQEISSIMRSFERFGYAVKSYFLANEQYDDFYRSRYEEFMKYMNI